MAENTRSKGGNPDEANRKLEARFQAQSSSFQQRIDALEASNDRRMNELETRLTAAMNAQFEQIMKCLKNKEVDNNDGGEFSHSSPLLPCPGDDDFVTQIQVNTDVAQVFEENLKKGHPPPQELLDETPLHQSVLYPANIFSWEAYERLCALHKVHEELEERFNLPREERRSAVSRRFMAEIRLLRELEYGDEETNDVDVVALDDIKIQETPVEGGGEAQEVWCDSPSKLEQYDDNEDQDSASDELSINSPFPDDKGNNVDANSPVTEKSDATGKNRPPDAVSVHDEMSAPETSFDNAVETSVDRAFESSDGDDDEVWFDSPEKFESDCYQNCDGNGDVDVWLPTDTDFGIVGSDVQPTTPATTFEAKISKDDHALKASGDPVLKANDDDLIFDGGENFGSQNEYVSSSNSSRLSMASDSIHLPEVTPLELRQQALGDAGGHLTLPWDPGGSSVHQLLDEKPMRWRSRFHDDRVPLFDVASLDRKLVRFTFGGTTKSVPSWDEVVTIFKGGNDHSRTFY